MDIANADDSNIVSKRSQFGRQFLIWLGVAGIAFILGFLPMWWTKRSVANELATTKRELKRQQIENSLSAAAVYARRGEYEPARQNASSFFTEMQSEMNSSDPVALTAQEPLRCPHCCPVGTRSLRFYHAATPASADRFPTYLQPTGRAPAAEPQK